MSTTAFLQRYDSFPEQMKEDLSIISEYLLFYYQPKANAARSNFIKPSGKALTNEEQTILAQNAENDLLYCNTQGFTSLYVKKINIEYRS